MGPKPDPHAGILSCIRHLLAQEARKKHFEWGRGEGGRCCWLRSAWDYQKGNVTKCRRGENLAVGSASNALLQIAPSASGTGRQGWGVFGNGEAKPWVITGITRGTRKAMPIQCKRHA